MTRPTAEAFALAQKFCVQCYHRLHRVRRLDGNDYFLLLTRRGEVIDNCMTWEQVEANICRLQKMIPAQSTHNEIKTT
jgi:hypothetical protein